jgi:hypothetical protein
MPPIEEFLSAVEALVAAGALWRARAIMATYGELAQQLTVGRPRLAKRLGVVKEQMAPK